MRRWRGGPVEIEMWGWGGADSSRKRPWETAAEEPLELKTGFIGHFGALRTIDNLEIGTVNI